MFPNFKFLAKMIFNTKPSPHFPKTHHSNVPPFHYSNWGEAPKFCPTLGNGMFYTLKEGNTADAANC
jgi:hypothetical protein